MRHFSLAAAAALLIFACQGCSIVLPAVGTAAAMGIDYTAKNCPVETFTCKVDCVHGGVLEALDTMSMKVTEDKKTPEGYKVKANAKGLNVTVEMVRLTETTTKVGVDAAKYIILRDGATAKEIVAQVEQALERRGALQAGTERPKPEATAKPAPEST